jgi:5-(carboxyamino)imidazole ribonucleotide mutase
MTEFPRGHGEVQVERATQADMETEVEEELAEIDVEQTLVAIVMGSESDMETMKKAEKELDERGIPCEIRVMSAHRQPDLVAEYSKELATRGFKVVIAGAGLSAALPGTVAAHTSLPVIGVPLTSANSALGGMDALLSCAQMPPGVPVAAVGLNSARNAAILAARIIEA